MTAAASELVGRLADELAARWEAGERPPAEEYLDRHPALWADAAAGLELVAEELALRAEFGPLVGASELAGRFPQWAAQVRALAECQDALGVPAAAAWPAPGETLGDFRLVREIGRGGHARVFLATQPALAGREVVLKVGPERGAEHLSLARLQHSHIVPLLWCATHPERRLRVLVMPWFGGASLAHLLDRVAASGRPGSGADLLPEAEGRGPLRAFLATASAQEAVCHLGACLADALQYAHDRGVLHLDVKPSNVLIAGDGVPMLLDFHLARPPLSPGDPAPDWLGGTAGYAAPEQREAIAAVSAGTPVVRGLDARTDIFALGRTLAEVLEKLAVRPAPGLADIVARCAAPDPADRYPSAGAVADDLRRQLADAPLLGVPNRSAAERWRKWRRRRPHALPTLLVLSALALTIGVTLSQASRLAQLRETRAAEARQRAAAELRGFLDAARREAANGAVSPELANACRRVWASRAALAGEPSLAGDLFDAAALSGDPAALAEARAAWGEAGGAWDALAAGRAKLSAGDPAAALAELDRAVRLDPRSAWVHHLRGVCLLKLTRPVEAVAAFSAAVAREPDAAWLRHNRGLAFEAAGEAEAARADITGAGGP